MHEHLTQDGLRCRFKVSMDHSGSVLQSEWQLWFPHLWPHILPSYLPWQLQRCRNLPARGRKQNPTKPPNVSPAPSQDKPVLQKAQEHFCWGSRFECDIAVQFCSWNCQCKGEQHSDTFRYFFGYFLGTFSSLRGKLKMLKAAKCREFSMS